jgi:hypothetical protein
MRNKIRTLLREQGDSEYHKLKACESFLLKKFPIGNRITIPKIETNNTSEGEIIKDLSFTITNMDISYVEYINCYLSVKVNFHYGQIHYIRTNYMNGKEEKAVIELNRNDHKDHIESILEDVLKGYARYFNSQTRIGVYVNHTD